MSKVLPQQYHVSKENVAEIIRELHQMSIEIGHEEMIKILGDVRNRLNDPFMFVVVGEVKSGKSSFINALLEAEHEICPVAPHPMTDSIQQIVYGEQEEEQVINPYLKRIFRPEPILKDIAIVDTPGTNTIIENHQEITERFIPSTDLIVLVFEAKNPYRQSSWDFFDLISEEWRKKVIFDLQQKDLMENEDIAINLNGVRDMAEKKGMSTPHIFAVSAKRELDGKLGESGFEPLRNYISSNITGGKAPFLKLESGLNTASNFAQKIHEGLDVRRKQLEADLAFREDIDITLNDQEGRSRNQVEMLIEHLVIGFEKIAASKREELSRGLSFFSLLRRSITSIFSKKSSLKSWLNQLATEIENEMQSELHQRLDQGVEDLAESIRTMVQMIDLKIKGSETILRNDHELFSDIAEKRSSVLYDLQHTFSQFLNDVNSFKDNRLFPSAKDLSPQVAAGSGLAIIGILLTTVTQGMVFDITGGVITAIGLLFAGITAGLNKGKVLKNFDNEISSGHQRMEGELKDKLFIYISHLKEKIHSHFERFDQHLEREKGQVASLDIKLKEVRDAIGTEEELIKAELLDD